MKQKQQKEEKQHKFSKDHLLKLFQEKNLTQMNSYILGIDEQNQQAQKAVVTALHNTLCLNKNTPIAILYSLLFYKRILLNAYMSFYDTPDIFPIKIHEAVYKNCQYKSKVDLSERGKTYFSQKLQIPSTKEIQDYGINYIILSIQLISNMAKWYPKSFFTQQPSIFAIYYKKLLQEGVCFQPEGQFYIVKKQDHQRFLKNYNIFKQQYQQQQQDEKQKPKPKQPQKINKTKVQPTPQNSKVIKPKQQEPSPNSKIIKPKEQQHLNSKVIKPKAQPPILQSKNNHSKPQQHQDSKVIKPTNKQIKQSKKPQESNIKNHSVDKQLNFIENNNSVMKSNLKNHSVDKQLNFIENNNSVMKSKQNNGSKQTKFIDLQNKMLVSKRNDNDEIQITYKQQKIQPSFILGQENKNQPSFILKQDKKKQPTFILEQKNQKKNQGPRKNIESQKNKKQNEQIHINYKNQENELPNLQEKSTIILKNGNIKLQQTQINKKMLSDQVQSRLTRQQNFKNNQKKNIQNQNKDNKILFAKTYGTFNHNDHQQQKRYLRMEYLKYKFDSPQKNIENQIKDNKVLFAKTYGTFNDKDNHQQQKRYLRMEYLKYKFDSPQKILSPNVDKKSKRSLPKTERKQKNKNITETKKQSQKNYNPSKTTMQIQKLSQYLISKKNGEKLNRLQSDKYYNTSVPSRIGMM